MNWTDTSAIHVLLCSSITSWARNSVTFLICNKRGITKKEWERGMVLKFELSGGVNFVLFFLFYTTRFSLFFFLFFNIPGEAYVGYYPNARKRCGQWNGRGTIGGSAIPATAAAREGPGRSPPAPRAHWPSGAARDVAAAAAHEAALRAVGGSCHFLSACSAGGRGTKVGEGLPWGKRGTFPRSDPHFFHPHQCSARAGRAHSRPQASVSLGAGRHFLFFGGTLRSPAGGGRWCVLSPANRSGRAQRHGGRLECGDRGWCITAILWEGMSGRGSCGDGVCLFLWLFLPPSRVPAAWVDAGQWRSLFLGCLEREEFFSAQAIYLLLFCSDSRDCYVRKWAWHVCSV